MTVDSATNTPAASAGAQQSKPADLANKETFLQLLVAQIKNQDPLKPADGVQFLSELASFSQLEQLMGIRDEIGSLREFWEAAAKAAEETEKP